MKTKVLKYIAAVALVVMGVFVTSNVDAEAESTMEYEFAQSNVYDYPLAFRSSSIVESNGVYHYYKEYTSYYITFDLQGGHPILKNEDKCAIDFQIEYYTGVDGALSGVRKFYGYGDDDDDAGYNYEVYSTFTGWQNYSDSDDVKNLLYNPTTVSVDDFLAGVNIKKNGYTLDGFYTEKYGQGEKITSSTVFTSDCTVYANWILTGPPSALKVKVSKSTFEDYYGLEWTYRENVDYYIVKIKSGSIKKTFRMEGNKSYLSIRNYSKKSKKKVTVKITPVNALGKGPTYKKTFKVKKTAKN